MLCLFGWFLEGKLGQKLLTHFFNPECRCLQWLWAAEPGPAFLVSCQGLYICLMGDLSFLPPVRTVKTLSAMSASTADGGTRLLVVLLGLETSPTPVYAQLLPIFNKQLTLSSFYQMNLRKFIDMKTKEHNKLCVMNDHILLSTLTEIFCLGCPFPGSKKAQIVSQLSVSIPGLFVLKISLKDAMMTALYCESFSSP